MYVVLPQKPVGGYRSLLVTKTDHKEVFSTARYAFLQNTLPRNCKQPPAAIHKSVREYIFSLATGYHHTYIHRHV